MSRLRGVLHDPLLSVVMPCFNESETIEEIIHRVLAVPVRTQLIVVDDGSSDGTRDILGRLQRELGFTLVLFCGYAIAGITGARRLETGRARRGAVLASLAGPLLLLAGFLIATY